MLRELLAYNLKLYLVNFTKIFDFTFNCEYGLGTIATIFRFENR